MLTVSCYTQLQVPLWLPMAVTINPNSLTSPTKPRTMWPLPTSLALFCCSYSRCLARNFFLFLPHIEPFPSSTLLQTLFFLLETLVAFSCLCLDKFYRAPRLSLQVMSPGNSSRVPGCGDCVLRAPMLLGYSSNPGHRQFTAFVIPFNDHPHIRLYVLSPRITCIL